MPKTFIESSPYIQALKPVNVAAHPDGWPEDDAAAVEKTPTVVWYFDGLQAHPDVRPVAWTFERPDGGRSFGFMGPHHLAGLDQPHLRNVPLNAIVWTAGIEVPQTGVRSELADAATRIKQEAERAPRKAVTEAVVTRPADDKVIDFAWGQLTWYVSRELGNSDTMTVGQAVIRPGKENPRHYHPNCDEVLHVVKGHILHTMNERTVEMRSGDTLSIPTGVKHNAKNIGSQDAVLAISFSSADRQVVGE